MVSYVCCLYLYDLRVAVDTGKDIMMKKQWKITLGIVAPIMLLGLIVYYFLFFSRSIFVLEILWDHGIRQAQRRRVLLLCNTDHQALLNAGREILSRVPKDSLNPRPDGIRHLGDIGVPKGVEIPQAIRDLKPRGCLVSLDGYLTLEMHGGMDHFGVRIYPEDYKEPDRYFKYGDRELLPGLWYYDDGYLHNPEYDKRINELIEKHKEKK
jgi:hypothetical protein